MLSLFIHVFTDIVRKSFIYQFKGVRDVRDVTLDKLEPDEWDDIEQAARKYLLEDAESRAFTVKEDSAGDAKMRFVYLFIYLPKVSLLHTDLKRY